MNDQHDEDEADDETRGHGWGDMQILLKFNLGYADAEYVYDEIKESLEWLFEHKAIRQMEMTYRGKGGDDAIN